MSFLQGTYIPKTEDDVERLVDKYISDVTRSDGTIYKESEVEYEYIKTPVFRNATEKKRWWAEQIRRCREGHDGMAPVMYFYFHFCRILTPQGKKIRPKFYRTQNEFFWWWENRLRGDKIGRGIILLKRRRWGFSWAAEAGILHEALFYPHSYIGQQSKTEQDVIGLFDKLKFIYNNLPDEIRPEAKNFSMKKIFFAKEDRATRKLKGIQSLIECRLSQDTAWESTGMKIWYSDESGKIDNIGRIWRMTEPTLKGEDGFHREGLAVIGGTAGDVDKDAWEFVELWTDSEAHDLDRFFVPGWANMNIDRFGNEDVRKSVHQIMEKRWKLAGKEKDLYAYMQQFPLTPEEALLGGESPCFDIKAINSQMTQLAEDPPSLQQGYFQWLVEGETVRFVPDPNGSAFILEHPHDNCDYLGGTDPVDHSGGGGSLQSTIIYKMQTNLPSQNIEKIAKQLKANATTAELMEAYLKIGDLPVMYMSDNPSDPSAFWEQSLMAAIYYSRRTYCKLHIERNRPGMIGWFDNNGYRNYLHRSTSKPSKGKNVVNYDFGDHMDGDKKNYRTSLIDKYIRARVGRIFFYELLKHMKAYDPDQQRKKFDDVDAFGMCLLKTHDKRLKFSNTEQAGPRIPKRIYKNVNGKLQLVVE